MRTCSAPRSAMPTPGSLGGRCWRLLLAFRYLPGRISSLPPVHGAACAAWRACRVLVWLVIGRHGGKSFAMALIAVFLAVFKDWRPKLSPGERAIVLLVAADREQA
jgi:hypothetical protein